MDGEAGRGGAAATAGDSGGGGDGGRVGREGAAADGGRAGGGWCLSFQSRRVRKRLLENIDAECAPGRVTALMGGSGSGKV